MTLPLAWRTRLRAHRYEHCGVARGIRTTSTKVTKSGYGRFSWAERDRRSATRAAQRLVILRQMWLPE